MSPYWYTDGETIDATEPVSWDFTATGTLGWPQTSGSELYENVWLAKGNNGTRSVMDEVRVATDYANALPAAIPEPSSIMLMLTAVGSVVLLRRNKH